MTTWGVFRDIAAAFDRVGRRHLFRALEVLGFPRRMVAVLKDLHKRATFSFKVGERYYTVRNRAGVRTGDRAGPDLFLVVMVAVFAYVRWPEGAVPVYVASPHWRSNGVGDGPSVRFELPCSSYADDCFLMFATRAAAAAGLTAFVAAVKEISGMAVHFASAAAAVGECKTVAMVFVAPGVRYVDVDTSPLEFAVGGGASGYVGFVEQAKYLGVVFHWDLGSERALDARLGATAAASAALKRVVRGRGLSTASKGVVIKSAVLPLMLYGAEVWHLTASMERRMSAAWNATCRSAVGVAVVDMRRSGERTSEVRARLGVMGVMDYYNHRVFTWLAKVLLMGQHRYPRLLITATAEVLECERAEHSVAQGGCAAAAAARRGGARDGACSACVHACVTLLRNVLCVCACACVCVCVKRWLRSLC